jgi:quinol monooxygenase YgiN
MIIVWGSVEVTAADIDAALSISLEHVRLSRQEPGCISHAVHIDAENPNHLIFNEEWHDVAALHTHFELAESIAFAKAISAIAIKRPEIRIFEAARLK